MPMSKTKLLYESILSSATERKAAMAGVLSGIMAGSTWLQGQHQTALLILGSFFTLALGLEGIARRVGRKQPFMDRPKLARAIRREPIYAIVSEALTFIALAKVYPIVT